MLDESRDRFRRSYAAGRAAYRRDSLADNYSDPATLVAVLVPAMLIGLLYVWLHDYKMLSLMRSGPLHCGLRRPSVFCETDSSTSPQERGGGCRCGRGEIG
jgi:hypothetical protein